MSQSDQILRTGVLFKKGSGSGLLGRKNWKPRYFVLTPSKLKYFTFEDGDLRGEVDLTGCDEGMVEVMPMDSMKTGSSASTIWRIAVNAPERRLLVAAGTEMEMNDWVDKLMMAFRINNGGPMHLPQRTSFTQQAPNSLNNGFSNSGNGSLSGSMNGSSGGAPGSGNGGASITDFQNFTIARRMHHGGRQSMNPDHPRLSDEKQQQVAEQRRVELQRHADEEHEMAQRQQQEYESEQLRLEEMEREQAYQIEQTRRHEEAKQEAAEAAARRQQQEAEEARRYHEEALRQEVEEEAQRLALEHQLLAVEREREEERQRIEADKLLEQQRQSQEAMLEQQRRLKREKHERERAEREQQMREVERQAELERQKAQLAAQESFSFDQSESGEEYDLDEEEEVAPVPRSSLIGDVKREAMMKQQVEHQRRREAALKEDQRRQRSLELEKKITSMHVNAGSHQQQPHREVEIPSRVVEIVRRAPPAMKAPEEEATPAARRSTLEKTASFEF